MKRITYHGVGEFKLPESWSEVTIKQFQEIEALQIEKETERSLAYLEIFTGIKSEDLRALPFTDLLNLDKEIGFINSNNKAEIKYIIDVDGVKYGLQYDFTKMKTSEYIDFDTLVTSENVIGNIHAILALLYRPIVKDGKGKKDYKIEDYTSDNLMERAEIFREEMSVEIMLSAFTFLQAVVLDLSGNLSDFLTQTTKRTTAKKTKSPIKVSPSVGGGFLHSIRSAARTLFFKMLGSKKI